MNEQQRSAFSSRFPGLDEGQIRRLLETVDAMGFSDPLQKMEKQKQLYQQVLPLVKEKQQKEQRIQMQNQIFNQRESADSTEDFVKNDIVLKTSEFADKFRSIYNIPWKVSDEAIISEFQASDPNFQQKFSRYLNGDREVLSELGLISHEEEQVLENWSRFWLLRPQDKERNDNYFWKMKATEQDLNADTLDYLWWFIKNVGKSAVNLASDVGNAVLNPIDTANNILKLGAGSVLNSVGLDDRAGEKSEWLNEANKISDGMGEHIKKRFWSREAFSKAAYEDPVGLFSDLSWFTSLGANVLKAGAKLTAKAGARAGVNTSLLSKAGDIAGDVAKVVDSIDPATHLMNEAGEIIKWGIGKAGELGKNVLDKTGISDKLNLDAFVGLDKQTKKGIQNNPYTQEMRERSKSWIEENGIPAKSQEVAKDLI